MPTDPVTRTEREALAEQQFETIERELGKCPDDHDVMKPVPNRAERRRAKRKGRTPSHVPVARGRNER